MKLKNMDDVPKKQRISSDAAAEQFTHKNREQGRRTLLARSPNVTMPAVRCQRMSRTAADVRVLPCKTSMR